MFGHGESRALDFIIIGAQKAGTTSLWRYLLRHPVIQMPEGKEAQFFARPDGDDREAYAAFYDTYFADVPRGHVVGTVTPHYMMGNGGISAERIAERISRMLPDVRIVALLRDPTERAISHYRMSVRRGIETRTFEEAATQLLDPAELERARRTPDETNSYLVQGEYGRVLTAYHRLFPEEQLCILLSADLERHPGDVLDRVLGFLGLPPGYRPDGLGVHHHRGGTRPRVDAEASTELLSFMELHIFPHCTPRDRDAFHFFFETWNVIPDDERPAVSPDLRAALNAHFAIDAAKLKGMGVEVPWAGTGVDG